ncbi:MAG: sensor histidine kinase [Sphingopyxis sp.]
MPASVAALGVAGLVLAAGAGLGVSMHAAVPVLLAMGLAGVAAVIAAWSGQFLTAPAPLAQPAMHDAGPLHRHHGFDDLFDAMGMPLLIVDGGRVQAANAAARDLLGGFIVDADVRAAIRHPAAADRLAHPQGRGAGGAIDLIGIGRPGQRWEMRTMPLADGSHLVALTDETARDAIERMRADFVANASHELRTPLAAILGFVETLSDPDAGGDAALRQRFLGVIDTEARRMQRLVEDLLSMSRVEASKAHFPQDQLSIGALVRQVVGEMTATGAGRAADIALHLVAEGMICADRAQMSQMLHNIIGNAMKYGRDATPIIIALTMAGPRMIELSVADQGDGISGDHLPLLTERFYRVDSARSRSLGGTGLGLAIVKHVVERHRGRLDIESVVGTGTTVRVRLPIAG